MNDNQSELKKCPTCGSMISKFSLECEICSDNARKSKKATEEMQEILVGAGAFLLLAGGSFLLRIYGIEYRHRLSIGPTVFRFIGKWGTIIFLGLAILSLVYALVLFISRKKNG